MNTSKKIIAVVGATGAQGGGVVARPAQDARASDGLRRRQQHRDHLVFAHAGV